MLLVSVVVFALLALSAAIPPVSRSRSDIEAFRNFLETSKTDNGQFRVRMSQNPQANAEENSGKYEGDIVLDDFMVEDMVQDYASGRNAYLWPGTRWPNNVVVYDYAEGNFNQAQIDAIEEGIADIVKNTCIKFRYREPQDSNYVHVTGQSNGCYAHVGFWRTRGPHIYNLTPNTPGVSCFRYGTIVHEWMHILGFFHMHSTHDRDNYVQIADENITPGQANAFRRYSETEVDNHGIEYDYVSCLHYSPLAFSFNGRPTIIATQQHEGVMGQRVYITDKDWLRINRHYNCPGAWD